MLASSFFSFLFLFLPQARVARRGGISSRRYLFHENALTRHEIRDINSQPSLSGKSIGQKTNIRENPAEDIGYYYYHSFHGVSRRDIGLKTVNSIFGAVWRIIVNRTCVKEKKRGQMRLHRQATRYIWPWIQHAEAIALSTGYHCELGIGEGFPDVVLSFVRNPVDGAR